jgi:hypothetical protein
MKIMTDEQTKTVLIERLKLKIDDLLSAGYSFKFLNAGEGCAHSVSVISVPYDISDVEFEELINEYHKISSSIVSECRLYIKNKSRNT